METRQLSEMMTREQLLLLTTRQLDAMIEHWPSTDVIVRDGDVTLRTVYNGSWVVDIKRWGRLGDHFEFLLETSHRGVVWPLSNVQTIFSDWCSGTKPYGFIFAPPEHVLPMALLVVHIMVLQELSKREPRRVDASDSPAAG